MLKIFHPEVVIFLSKFETPDPLAEIIIPEPKITHPKDETVPPEMKTPRPGDEIVRPGSETTRPASEIVRPGSEIIRPGSEILRPGSEIIRPGREIIEPDHEIPQQTRKNAQSLPETLIPPVRNLTSLLTLLKILLESPRSVLLAGAFHELPARFSRSSIIQRPGSETFQTVSRKETSNA